MNKFIKTLIGFATIFLLLLLFTGSSAILLVLASIICTAGVGLVVWIPLSYVVGSIVVGIAQGVQNLSSNSKNMENLASAQVVKVTNNQKAIIDYIKLARRRGFQDNNIFANLRTNGWAEDAINEAFRLVATTKES